MLSFYSAILYLTVGLSRKVYSLHSHGFHSDQWHKIDYSHDHKKPQLMEFYVALTIKQEQRLKQYDIMYEIKCLELNEYIIKYNRNRVILELEHIKNIN